MQPLKFRNGMVIFSNTLLAAWLLVHAGIEVNLYWLIVVWWRIIAAGIRVNIGPGNGLLPDGTKPLPESMLTYHH